MKIDVRNNNTTFRLSDVERLPSEWIVALDPARAQSYFSHAEQHELIFRKADAYAEQIEEGLTDDDDDENELTADE